MKDKKKKRSPLRRMGSYGFKYKFRFVFIILLSLIVSGTKAGPAWMIKYLFDEVLMKKNMEMLVIMLGGLVVMTIVKGISMYYKEIYSSYTTRLVELDIQSDVYEHLHRLSHSYYDEVPQGEIMARMSNDSAQLGKVGFLAFQILPEALTVLLLLVGLFTMDPILATGTVVLLPLLMAIIRRILKKIKKTARKRQDQRGELNSLIQEALSGIKVIKAFGTEEKEIDTFKEKNKVVLNTEYRNKKVEARISPINEVVTTSLTACVLLYGGYKVIYDPNFTIGDLMAFTTSLGLMFEPLKKVIKRGSELVSIIPSAERVIEILDEDPEVMDRKNAVEVKRLNPRLSFKNLRFRYRNGKEDVLKGINLEVEAGEVVALVGRSGSGKTTLVNLIPRFYEITGGKLKIDGMDIRDMKYASLRQHIGIVPQETFLFSGSIYSNLVYGTKREVSQEEVINAAKMANAHDFIMEFENQYEQEVGERGTLLSGGQKQRIAITRALLRNPEIMILDEATSALDNESERLVQSAFEKLMVGRTTFVIAHRLSTIINADKIVVMDDGEIKEVGTHEELLRNNGIYSVLYNKQFKKKDKKEDKKDEVTK